MHHEDRPVRAGWGPVAWGLWDAGLEVPIGKGKDEAALRGWLGEPFPPMSPAHPAQNLSPLHTA